MNLDTSAWGWPQFTVLALLFLSAIYHAARHSEERVETTGERKGQPERFNGFAAMLRFALWMFLLVAGGFFA